MMIPYKEKNPVIDPTAKIFEGAKIIGQVIIGKHVGVWYNSVIRGDMAQVIIGDETNIQDGTVIHTNRDLPTHIGSGVTIGHMAIIHAATIEDDVLIGMGSIILDGALIKSQSLVAAGTVVPPGKIVESRTLVMGNPMKVLKTLSDEDIENIRKNKDFYVQLLKDYT